ncbi:MAG: hypothetical protein Ct9H300mP26_1580 [Acidimicrobiales bacterium]|nr:MAG: hypothetical protein Ct9H300mP26_1580 [Acidimicrobiales bacterium]
MGATMRAAFDERRVTIHRMLNEIEGVECLEPEGAFLCFFLRSTDSWVAS